MQPGFKSRHSLVFITFGGPQGHDDTVESLACVAEIRKPMAFITFGGPQGHDDRPGGPRYDILETICGNSGCAVRKTSGFGVLSSRSIFGPASASVST